MGVANPSVDPANVMQALVYTLLNVFDATRDLYQTLTIKEQRDYEQNLRAKGYPSSRRIEYVEDDRLGSDGVIAMDRAAVTRQFEIGYQILGTEFAVGDVTSHIALQSQIITLQNVLVTTFLYGPTSSDPISHQLSNVNAASRTAAAASVDILAALQQRQQDARPPTPRSMHSATARSSPVHVPSRAPSHVSSHHQTATGPSSHSTALMKYHEPPSRISPMRSSSPVNTTILEWRGRIKPERTDADATSMTGPSSHGTKSTSPNLYCLYALDLQRYATQSLSSSITSQQVPYCPECNVTLHMSPGKAWEICKWDMDCERTFQVQNRFVVKCHRDGPDGQYACVICSEYASCDTVCGDVKALVKHLSDDHDIRELKHEQDIVEVIEQPVGSRRDSGTAHGSVRGSRRSASLAPSRRRKSVPMYERESEVDVYDAKSFRR